MSIFELRRVVTGLNAEGRSCFIFNGSPPSRLAGDNEVRSALSLWQTEGPRPPNDGNAEAAPAPFNLSLTFGSTKFLTTQFAPVPGAANLDPEERARRARAASNVTAAVRVNSDHPGMHATDTIDYVVVVSGEITLVLEEGEQVLRQGDVVIDRGVAHAWENRGVEPAIIVAVLIDAEPLPHRRETPWVAKSE